MEIEHTQIEYKSLKKAYGAKANLKELAETCVCLANAQGGMLYIGVDDKDKLPPENQKISQKMVNDVLSRLRSLTDSVGLGDAIIETHENGWQYFHFKVLATSRTIATTSSGKILLRIQDKCFPISDFDFTKVIQSSEIIDEEVVFLLEYISQHYQLSQKQFIALGIIAREKKSLGTELIKQLQLQEDERLRSYVVKLEKQQILISRGVRKGKQYLINPELLKSSKLNIKPSLKTIEPHRLIALIESDLQTFPNSTIKEIHKRIPDVNYKDLQKTIYKMAKDGVIKTSGASKNRTYFMA